MIMFRIIRGWFTFVFPTLHPGFRQNLGLLKIRNNTRNPIVYQCDKTLVSLFAAKRFPPQR